MHQGTWLWRDIWALLSLSCISMVHWEAKCTAVKPQLTNMRVHTHLTTLYDLSDERRQRQGRPLHGTLGMIRSNSPKCSCHHIDTILKSKTVSVVCSLLWCMILIKTHKCTLFISIYELYCLKKNGCPKEILSPDFFFFVELLAFRWSHIKTWVIHFLKNCKQTDIGVYVLRFCLDINFKGVFCSWWVSHLLPKDFIESQTPASLYQSVQWIINSRIIKARLGTLTANIHTLSGNIIMLPLSSLTCVTTCHS